MIYQTNIGEILLVLVVCPCKEGIVKIHIKYSSIETNTN